MHLPTKALAVLGCTLSLLIATRADVFHGQVVNEQNQPIANAELLVQSGAAQNPKDEFRTLHTDEQGNFSFDLSPGYSGYYGRLLVSSSGMSVTGLSLSESIQSKNNVIQLHPAQTVSGRVLDANEKPVAGVKVELRGYFDKGSFPSTFFMGKPWEDRYQASTDENGQWHLKAVPVGANASMIVADPRFVSQFFNAFPDTPAIIHVRPGATLRGRVVDENGTPAAKVEVSAQGQDQSSSAGWAQATSANDGSYQLTGLSSGSYNVMVSVADNTQVAKAIEGQAAHEGKTEELPDLVLTPGVLITGRALNSKTGKGVPQIMIGAYGPQNPRTSAAAKSAITDKNGNYKIRVFPGGNYVYLMGAAGYIQKPNDGKNIDVLAGQTVTQDFELDPGESVSGVVVDRQGKPLSDVTIVASVIPTNNRFDFDQDNHSARSDVNGRWKISGLAKGNVKISAKGEWVTGAPVPITLPRERELQIVAQRLSDFPANARIVDIHNQPIPQLSIQLQYATADDNTGGTSIRYESVTSNDKGELRFKPLPNVTDVKVFRVLPPGYLVKDGGTWDKATETLGEIVLDRLDNSITGQLLNERGEPVAGAKVDAAGFTKATAKTDEKGQFTLTGLPHQPITVLATNENLVAKSTSKADGSVVLKLAPLPPNQFPTQEQSLEMLEKLYRDTTFETFWSRGVVPYEVAKYDLQRGLDLLKDDNGHIPASQFYPVLYLLQEKHPARALQWGKDHLDDVTKDSERIQALCKLAKLAQPQDAALATEYYSQAVAIAETFPAPEKKTYSSDELGTSDIGKFLNSRVQLADAAAIVAPSETHKWLEQILPYSVDPNRGTRGDYDWIRDAMAQSLGASAPKEVEFLIENSQGRSQSIELRSALKAAVRAKDSKLALRWLNQFQTYYEKNKTQDPTSIGLYDFGPALRAAIELIGPSDSAQALKMARMIDDKSQTAQSLMVAAPFQPKEIELATLKEAYELQSLQDSKNLARMAAMIYDISPEQGKGLFDQLLQRYESQQDSDQYSPSQIRGTNLAYFVARYKPAESWKILQSELAGSHSQTNPGQRIDSSIVLAMSALNFDVAMKWAELDSSRGDNNNDAKRKLLQIALATPEVRRTLRFDRLGASDTWTPGEPTEW